MDETSFQAMGEQIKDLNGIDVDRCSGWHEGTRLVRGYADFDRSTGTINAPLYFSTAYAHPEFGKTTGFCYSRCGNPTRLELENTIAMLEHGKKAWAFSSGMAAISTLLKLFAPGDHVIVGDDLYGGTYRLIEDVYAAYGVDFQMVDATDAQAIRAAIRSTTRGIFVETPTNPMMKVVDLAATAALAHEAGAILIVDNTFLTPYFQKPFDLGADVVVHSGTKYLGGHHDITSGFIVVRDESLVERIFMLSMSEGGMLSPFDSWLTLRSLKTLGVRMEKQQANAFALVDFLKQHPRVTQVVYPGDPDHPAYSLSQAQTTGFGAMVSFKLAHAEDVPVCLNRLKLILFAESLGGVESLMTFPLVQTHGAMPADLLDRLGIDDRLLRFSVGLEDPEDLIRDLEQALS
jgi:cystathionine gamma-synthase